MEFKSQKYALEDLSNLAQHDRHSVLIEGPKGCGKSYAAKQYANMLGLEDYVEVLAKVNDIRDAVDYCVTSSNRVLICVENLDEGVPGSSYTLLKFLEEPSPNVYVVVTCRNIKGVPDTIVSRSAVVTLSPPVPSDIAAYSEAKNLSKTNMLRNSLVWNCCKSFSEIDKVLSMTLDEVNYYESVSEIANFKDSVSSLSWKLGHYDSGSESDLELVIRCIIRKFNDPNISMYGIECIRDVNSGRIAKHACLAKFLFQCKYWE